MSQIVVSDSTCLIGLQRIARLELLSALFDRVWIPPAVAEEFGQTPEWLMVRAPENLAFVESLELLIDRGEAAAIALAKELGCEVILDDKRARKLALANHVPQLGLLGILLRAKKSGKLPAVRPIIDALRAKSFFLSEKLIADTLRQAKE